MDAIIIFISQLALVFFKHLTVRTVNNHQILKSAFYTAMIQISWLVSSALGINALLNNEWLSVVSYILGGVVGSVLQFRIRS